LDDRRIGTRVELKSGDRNERESDVGTVRPGERLGLIDLHREVHPRLVATEPAAPGELIRAIAVVNPLTERGEVLLPEVGSEVLRLNGLGGEGEAGLELKHLEPYLLVDPMLHRLPQGIRPNTKRPSQ